MKRLLLSAAFLSLVSCTPEPTKTAKQVQSDDFHIMTVQVRTVEQGQETSKEDQLNAFTYDSDKNEITWTQEGESEDWVYKVLVKTGDHFTLLEAATEEDEAHTFNLDLANDKNTVVLSTDGSEEINYYEVNKK